jgi:hypothetical protein
MGALTRVYKETRFRVLKKLFFRGNLPVFSSNGKAVAIMRLETEILGQSDSYHPVG